MSTPELIRYYAGGRVVVGAVLLLFPGRTMRDLLGATDRRTKAVGRMLGVRDLLLGLGALSGNGPVRPWMTYSAIADATDAVALLLAYKQLPRWKRAVFVAMAAGGAATGGYLVSQIDD